MNIGERRTALRREDGACGVKRVIAQDWTRDGLAVDAAHQETVTKLITAVQNMQDLGDRDTRLFSQGNQFRFRRQADGSRRSRSTGAARGTSQDCLLIGAAQRPGFLAGPAGQASKRLQCVFFSKNTCEKSVKAVFKVRIASHLRHN